MTAINLSRGIIWRLVDSSNVRYVGWPQTGERLMLVKYKSGKTYGYLGVSRQRTVSLAHRRRLWGGSVGRYINKVIKPNYECVLLRKEDA